MEQDIKDFADDILDKAASTAIPALKSFSGLLEMRVARLKKAAEQMKTTLGEKHSDTVAMVGTHQRLQAIIDELKTRIEEINNRPKPDPKKGEWLIFGRVTYEGEKPAPDLNIYIGTTDTRHKETKTDKLGNFKIIYSKTDYEKFGSKPLDLFLTMSNKEGKKLYSSPDKMQYKAGHSEFFVIVLEKSPK